MIKIKNNDLSVLDENRVRILDFNATWCGPCRAVKPSLEALEKVYTNYQFADIDADENEQLCDLYGVRNLPTIIMLNGDKSERVIGGMSKSEIEIKLKLIGG